LTDELQKEHMRSLVLALALAACSQAPSPSSPKAPPVNLACQQARTIDKNAACLPLRTAVAGVPDIALADVGAGILVRCSAGEGMGAGCAPFADLRPRQAEPKSEALKVDGSPQPTTPAPQHDGPTTPPVKDKPKAVPPQKPEPKK
jgi:hypothetical protein